MNSVRRLNRRSFIRHLGLGATVPLLASRLQAGEPVSPAAEFNLLSCNIRVALPRDETTGNGWRARKDLCMRIIRNRCPDIFCLQEVIHEQWEDFRGEFREFAGHGFVGPYMDRHPEGYHWVAKNVIFYARSRFECVSAGHYWLSEMPHLAGSKSWGTARARHVNWVRLRDAATGREFRVLDAHLDHESQPARERQAAMIAEECAQYRDELPQLLAGDFNAGPDNPVFSVLKTGGWADTYPEIHGAEDPGYTGHGFRGAAYPEHIAPKKPPARIDFILRRGAVSVLDAAIIRDHEDGRYPSDHYFVSARVSI